MLEHIIFDFDGVIADTFDINWSLSQEHDPTATPEDFLAHHDGNVFAEPRIKFRPENIHLFHAGYRGLLTTGHLAKALPPIQRLGAKYLLYVISSTSERNIRGILEQAGILHLFVRVMGEETHKSKVEKFKMVMADCGVTPENSVFITDTLGDVKEAEKVAIRTIAETFGFHNKERLAQGNPFAILDSWEEIEQMVSTL